MLRPTRGRADDRATSEELTGKAVDFLRPRQADDGSWSGDRKEPGITALVVTPCSARGGSPPADPTVTKALAYLERFLGPKGGLSEAPHANYTTAIALMAFQEANRTAATTRIIKGGQEFLKAMQWDEGEGKGRDTTYYGGAGYGGRNSRPDLSNTAFMMEALRDTGLPADDPALQKALIFVSRCQNLKSEFNDQPWAGKVNDGGFIYTAANGGSSMAGKTEDGGLRSYAAMTYAGLKSMIYAGLTADDPRARRRSTTSRSTTASTRTRASASGGSTITTRRSPRRWPSSASRRSSTPRARSTTGGPNSWRPWRSVRVTTAVGSTGPTASWKATRTS